MDIISFIVIGFVAGTLGTILGLGGGILIIPFLLLIHNYSPQQTAGTSLAVVFLNSLSGSLAYARQRRIDYKSAWKFALATLPGAIGGSYASQYFTDKSFRIVFGIFLIIVAISIFRRGEKKIEDNNIVKHQGFCFKLTPRFLVDSFGREFNYAVNERLGILISFFVGFLASALGVGGGIIHVPSMIYLLNFPTHIATATSQTILAISAFWGSSVHFFLDNVNLMAALPLGLGAMLGAQLGAFLSRKMKATRIIKFLAIALILVGIRLAFM